MDDFDVELDDRWHEQGTEFGNQIGAIIRIILKDVPVIYQEAFYEGFYDRV